MTPVQEGGAAGSAAPQQELDLAEEDAAFARALQAVYFALADEEQGVQQATPPTARVPGQPTKGGPAGGELVGRPVTSTGTRQAPGMIPTSNRSAVTILGQDTTWQHLFTPLQFHVFCFLC